MRAKYADAEAAAGFAVAMTNRLTENLTMPAGTTLAVHLCRRAGGKARGEHGALLLGVAVICLAVRSDLSLCNWPSGVEFDGNIKRIIHHINDLQGVQHLTIECTTPDQASELVALKDLRDDFEIGFGASLAQHARDA